MCVFVHPHPIICFVLDILVLSVKNRYVHAVLLLMVFFVYILALPGTQPVQLYQSGRGLCVSGACEALFQTHAGVQTPVHNSHKPRRQASGWSD